MNKFFSFIIFFFLVSFSSYSQTIHGVVIDAESNKPIQGAAVYFKNTTIGISTNRNGEFRLKYNNKINTPLMVSFIGYKTVTRKTFSKKNKIEIYLFKSNESLNEIVIKSKGGWSRSLKMKEFLKHFLGETKNGQSCKVLNKKDIILRYNPKKKQLTATSKSPIFIKNKKLKYDIYVDLAHFEVNYSFVSRNKKRLNLKYVYYSGSNYFKSTEATLSKKTIERRKETYDASVLKFMRALSKVKLRKRGYHVFLGNEPVDERWYIKVSSDAEDDFSVKVRIRKTLNIYRKGKQSSIKSLADIFFIDAYGNHFPSKKVVFGGEFGSLRMGDTLPLDYLGSEEEKKE